MNDTNFRVYTSSDIIGCELGGAFKNIIALGAGISDGLGLGDNSKAAFMTRGLTEIARLGVKLGAKQETFAGLSGVGDLIVTCCSMHSRNRRAGILIGKGATAQEAMKEVGANGRGLLRDRGGLSPCTAAGRVHADHRSDVRRAVRRHACTGGNQASAQSSAPRRARRGLGALIRSAPKGKREGKAGRRLPVFCCSEKIAEKEKKVLTGDTSPDIINLALRR